MWCHMLSYCSTDSMEVQFASLLSNDSDPSTTALLHYHLTEATSVMLGLSMREIEGACILHGQTEPLVEVDFTWLLNYAFTRINWEAVSTRFAAKVYVMHGITVQTNSEFCLQFSSAQNIRAEVFEIVKRQKELLGFGHLSN